MCASSLSSCFVGLPIEGRPIEESESRRTDGGRGSLATVVIGVLLVGYLPPPSKGKGKISEIKYPCGSEYLRVAVNYADIVGPRRVEPSYAKTFATRYRPPPGVQFWCPDLLTSYVVPVPKMVCFFEDAFENGLRFPLNLFIKSVLHHFNVCLSQLSPNFRGVLVSLLVVFREKGFGVPSIMLQLNLFSWIEASKGFCIFQSGPLPDVSFPTFFLPTTLERALFIYRGSTLGIQPCRSRRYAGDSDSMDCP